MIELTLKVVWEMRIRDLEDEGWSTAFTDGSGLNLKAASGFCSNPNNTSVKPPGSKYLGTRSTHFNGELEGIALALENHTENLMLAIPTDSKPAIQVLEKLNLGKEGPVTVHMTQQSSDRMLTKSAMSLAPSK